MEFITWAEYKARCTDKKGFTLTHYSKLFNAAHCRVNIKGLDFQLGYDDRYSTKEWNNQVNQFKKAHLEHFVEITAEVAEEIKNTLSTYEADLVVVKVYLATGLSGFEYNGAIAKKAHLEMMVAKYTKMVELLPTFAADEDEKTGDVMTYQAMQKIKSGFIEAMYFADGADPDMKDDEGFYLDGQFNNCFDLSENAQKNVISLLETIVPKFPAEVFEVLTLDRIGMCIYYEVQGHGTGFQDEELSEEVQENLYQLFFNSVFLEIYDNDETQEIELSYSENWS